MTSQVPPSNLPAPAVKAPVEAARADLEAFEELMFQVLDAWGLPTDSIIVAAKQREALIRNTPIAIEELSDAERAKAPYIAKMVMAGSVGLFDAALNYLWNETVNRLRDHVAAFDVDYFFELAEPDPDRRKNLKTREDLSEIGDYQLLEAANRIKLISDVAFKQLTHINYMRNHASAAHPNIEELTGLKLAEWLETCIKEVFQLEPRNVVAEIGKLLHNVKAKRLPADELKKAATRSPGPLRVLLTGRGLLVAAVSVGSYSTGGRAEMAPAAGRGLLDGVRAPGRLAWRFVTRGVLGAALVGGFVTRLRRGGGFRNGWEGQREYAECGVVGQGTPVRRPGRAVPVRVRL